MLVASELIKWRTREPHEPLNASRHGAGPLGPPFSVSRTEIWSIALLHTSDSVKVPRDDGDFKATLI